MRPKKSTRSSTRRQTRSKVCSFCAGKDSSIDYKDIGKIRRYVSGRGKMLSSHFTGTCSKHQRILAQAIKRARFVGLLPFIEV